MTFNSSSPSLRRSQSLFRPPPQPSTYSSSRSFGASSRPTFEPFRSTFSEADLWRSSSQRSSSYTFGTGSSSFDSRRVRF